MAAAKHDLTFEEDGAFFVKKKLKGLGNGLLLLGASLFLPYMLIYLLMMAERFSGAAAQGLAFFGLTFIIGLYLTADALVTPRFAIHNDLVLNPGFLGERFIPIDDIETVTLVLTQKDTGKVSINTNHQQ